MTSRRIDRSIRVSSDSRIGGIVREGIEEETSLHAAKSVRKPRRVHFSQIFGLVVDSNGLLHGTVVVVLGRLLVKHFVLARICFDVC